MRETSNISVHSPLVPLVPEENELHVRLPRAYGARLIEYSFS